MSQSPASASAADAPPGSPGAGGQPRSTTAGEKTCGPAEEKDSQVRAGAHDPFAYGLKKTLAFLGVQWEKNKPVVTAVVVGYLLLKVLIVSQGDLSTALAVLRTVGLAGAIEGSLLSAVGVVAAAFLAFACGRLFWVTGSLFHRRRAADTQDETPDGQDAVALAKKQDTSPVEKQDAALDGGQAAPAGEGADRPSWWAAFGVAVLAAVVCAVVTPYPVALASVALGALVCLAALAHYAVDPRDGWSTALSVVSLALAVGMGLLVTYAVWLPHEVVTFTGDKPGEPQVEIVYVLDESGGWTTMLTHGDRKVITEPDSHITDRVVCHLDPSETNWLRAPTVWDLLVARHILVHPNSTSCATESTRQKGLVH